MSSHFLFSMLTPRTFKEIVFSNIDPSIAILSIPIEEKHFISMKLDNDFLYLLTSTSFKILCLETAETLFSKTLQTGQFKDFYVSLGDSFFVLLISKDTQKNLFFVVEQPGNSGGLSDLEKLGAGKGVWGDITRQFFFEKKRELGESQVFDQILSEKLFAQEVEFSLPEKPMLRLRFDQKLSHVFYVLFEDLSLETFKVRRDFRRRVQIERIGELNLDREGSEAVSLKLDQNLEFVGVENGQVWLYDSEHDLNLEVFDAKAQSDADEVSFERVQNSDALFKVSGPGFQIFESIQAGQVEADDANKSQLLTSRLNASKPRSKRPRSQLRSVIDNEGSKEIADSKMRISKSRKRKSYVDNNSEKEPDSVSKIGSSEIENVAADLNLREVGGLETDPDVLGSNQLIRQFLELDLVEEAFMLARKNRNRALLSVTATLALKLERVGLSKKCFQELGNVSMVMSLLHLEKENASEFAKRAQISLFLCDYSHSLMFYFLDGDFEKVLFLCSELKEYQLAISLIKFFKENVESKSVSVLLEVISTMRLCYLNFVKEQDLFN